MFPLRRLQESFPAIDDPNMTAAQRESSRLFEESQRNNPEAFAHKQKDRRTRVALYNGITAAGFASRPLHAESNVFLLDGHDLFSTAAFLNDPQASKTVTSYHVANWEAGTITEHMGAGLNHRVKLFGTSMENFIRESKGDILYDVVSIDMCNHFKQDQMDFVRDLIVLHPFATDRPVLLDVTFFSGREKDGNRQLLVNAKEGFDRIAHLRLHLIDLLASHGNHFTLHAPSCLQVGLLHHKMQSVFFLLMPKELAGPADHAKLTRLVESLPCIVKEARAPRPEDKVMPKTKAKAKGKTKSKQRSKPASPLFRKNQVVEVNFYDWRRYRYSNGSRLPAKIVELLPNGREARIWPLLNKGVCSEVETKTNSGDPSDFLVVPLTRVEHAPAPLTTPMLISDMFVGRRIETAWRSHPDEPMSWWRAIVVQIGASLIKVRSGHTGNVLSWIKPEWCRPMKEV